MGRSEESERCRKLRDRPTTVDGEGEGRAWAEEPVLQASLMDGGGAGQHLLGGTTQASLSCVNE
ncbi:hypothetical protein E2C01_033528 [Portunus trituberculatus]|uniref:Uncharacterized protein n=1 Tax=Portunus trituberculatus TaxID=210409 RepID=A0A5B7F2P1_PORTR|nr:hypothetical protein [Portunus trituberculatus]